MLVSERKSFQRLLLRIIRNNERDAFKGVPLSDPLWLLFTRENTILGKKNPSNRLKVQGDHV